jgi:hypothetical protein
MTPAGEAAANDESVTHGLCKRCARDFMIEELGEPLNEFLDRIGVPVVVVGPEFVIRTANKQACDLIGKKLSEIQHGRPGDVIECAHASEPGGCGEQIHCTACTIRLKVLETYQTGKSFENVPAYPGVCLFEDVKRMSVEISTQKVGEMVFVTIENLDTLIS